MISPKLKKQLYYLLACFGVGLIICTFIYSDKKIAEVESFDDSYKNSVDSCQTSSPYSTRTADKEVSEPHVYNTITINADYDYGYDDGYSQGYYDGKRDQYGCNYDDSDAYDYDDPDRYLEGYSDGYDAGYAEGYWRNHVNDNPDDDDDYDEYQGYTEY